MHTTSTPFAASLRGLLALLGLPVMLMLGQSCTRPDEGPALGWWRATIRHAGQSTDLYLHLTAGAEGGIGGALEVPAIVASMGLGRMEVTPDGLSSPAFDLKCEDGCRALSGELAPALVPLHKLAVRFEPAEAPPPLPPVVGARPAPVPRFTARVDGAVWAPLTLYLGRLYVASTTGDVVAFDAGDGSVSWRRQLAAGVRAAPAVVGDRLALHTTADEITLLRLDTGRVDWTTSLGVTAPERLPTDDPNSQWDFYDSAVIRAGTSLIVGTRAGTVHALDIRTGKERWRFSGAGAITGTPAMAGDRVLVASFDGLARALAVETGDLLWERDLGAALPSDVVVIGGRAWLGTRAYELHALEPSDGTTAWSRYFWFSWVDSAPREFGGVGYIGSSDALRVQALDSAGGRPEWSTRVPGWAWATPAVTPSAVFAGTVGTAGYIGAREGSLVALDRAGGSIDWIFTVEQADGDRLWGIASAPATAGSTVYVADLAGNVYAF